MKVIKKIYLFLKIYKIRLFLENGLLIPDNDELIFVHNKFSWFYGSEYFLFYIIDRKTNKQKFIISLDTKLKKITRTLN